jgi:hypothetical protein
MFLQTKRRLPDKISVDQPEVDRRCSQRNACTGIAGVAFLDGQHRGATFVGLLQDMSEGGVCVVFDAGVTIERGTAVLLMLHDDLTVSAWVCQSATCDEGCRIGLSFNPVNTYTSEPRANAGNHKSAVGKPEQVSAT